MTKYKGQWTLTLLKQIYNAIAFQQRPKAEQERLPGTIIVQLKIQNRCWL